MTYLRRMLDEQVYAYSQANNDTYHEEKESQDYIDRRSHFVIIAKDYKSCTNAVKAFSASRHIRPKKIISEFIQPIPHAFPLDEESKLARRQPIDN